ncbi:MAG TPA: alpha-hydroxy-acid oxidizing protein [Solirubrobacteraceae bacterium]|jgi:isopentenyl diphosphate isomerase/L-lactate dehydrogenase-like FMN-dependent dehydrogenase|nr:alpha-hydroxy-acid oxidizing protein [Solirubrobacteraceae bacterium]
MASDGVPRVPSEPSPSPVGPGRERQDAIYRAGIHGRRPRVPTDYATLERRARRHAPAVGWAYADAAAGEGATMRANREAFDRWKIVPRMLRDVSRRDLSVELFGRRLPAPVLFGPVGASELLHPEADLAIARAAAELGVPYVFTSQACAPMEACAWEMGEAPRWFQLYWSTDDGLVDSFLARAKAAGAEAVVVTLDTTMLGWRPKDLNLGSLPFARGQGIAQYTADSRFLEIVRDRIANHVGEREVEVTLGAIRTFMSITRRFPGRFLDNLRSPGPRASVETFLDIYSRPSLTWSDIETLRERTDLPVLLKGIQHPDDARRALDAGVDGIVVSNHGGRQVDGAIGSLDAMVDIVPVVDGRAKVLLDSGVRTGSDVFKALALGADAVLIGRPYLYGLTLAGQAGARDVMHNIIAEFDLTLGLSGLTSVGELGPEALRRI